MKLNKKGMEAGFLVALIITIVSGVLIGITVMKFSSSMDEKEAENLCHSTIALRAQTALNMNENSDEAAISAQVKAIPALCKTVDKTIKGNNEQIMEQMAQKIARCWWMFGEGRYDNILGRSSFKILPSVFGTNRQQNQCFNCYNLLIDQDSLEGGVISNIEFFNYLNTHNLPNLNLTYIEYIQQYGGPGMLVNIIDQGIKPRGSYAISILPMNREESKTNWAEVVGFTTMGVAFVGAIICSAVTMGGCSPLAMAAFTTISAMGGKVAATGIAVGATQGSAGEKEAPAYSGSSQGNTISVESMFKEREHSSIYVSDASFGTKFCGSGDLAGK